MRKLFAILLIFLSLILVSVISVAVFSAITDSKTRVQSLSAIASSVSAMVAAIVALWVAWREFDTRERARSESAAKEFTGRQRAAALLGGNITSWVDRKDTQDLLDELSTMESDSSAKEYLNLTAIANRSPKHKSDLAAPIYWLDEIIHLGTASRLAALERLSEIPNIWSLFAKGEWKGDLTGIDSNYFAVMDTTWTNLEMRSQEFRNSFLALQNFKRDEGDHFRILAWALMNEAHELRNTLYAFIDEARGAGKFLSTYVEGPSALSLHSPSDLQMKSLKRSSSVDDAWKVITFSRSAPLIASGMKEFHKTVDGLVSEGRSTIAYLEEVQRVFVAGQHAPQPAGEVSLESSDPYPNSVETTETRDGSAG